MLVAGSASAGDTNGFMQGVDKGVRAWTSLWGLDRRLSDYKLDLEGPIHITEVPLGVPLPTGVEIYVTGPRVYIAKSDTPASLSKWPPVWSSTNRTEISNLVSVLGKNDNKERITDVTTRHGYTFHLLLLQEERKTVMHFRVFQTDEFETPWREVYPRNDTGSCYFNDQIGGWLRSHLPTNALPPINVLTNTATK